MKKFLESILQCIALIGLIGIGTFMGTMLTILLLIQLEIL